MDSEQDLSVGARIAQTRKSRGWTQAELAARVPISLSLLRKVEQGSRDATPAFIASIARALNVDVTTLTGQPYDQHGRYRDRLHTYIPALRQALAYWDLPPYLSGPPRPWQQLRVETDGIADLRRAAQHTAIVERLPALLLETTAAAHAADEAAQGKYFALLAVQLFAAHSVTYKTGYQDLSTVIEDRIEWAAARSSDQLLGALAVWSRTTSNLQNGSYDIGLRLLDRTQAEIQSIKSSEQHRILRLSGPLHLRSAVLAARALDQQTAQDHLAEATRIAVHLGGNDDDGGWYQLSFGPSNVAIHEVAASVELGDGPSALDRARRVVLPSALPPIRAGQHYVDLSRAQMWAGDRDGALRSLYEARRLAPQQTRHLPTTREVLRMLVRAHRRSNEPLTRMIRWLGGEL